LVDMMEERKEDERKDFSGREEEVEVEDISEFTDDLFAEWRILALEEGVTEGVTEEEREERFLVQYWSAV